MKKRQVIIVASGLMLIIVSILLAGVFGGMKKPPEKELVTVQKKFVRTTTVSYKDQQTSIVAYGRVKSAKSLDLIAEVSGRMYEGPVNLKEGENFRKGTLIYYIDDTEARFTLNASKSDFLRDLATILPDLKIDFSDSYTTWRTYFQSIKLEEPLPPLPQPKTAKEKTFLATKSIFNSYYKIKSSEANLKKYRFYAPFEASLSSIDLQSGSFVNPGNKIGTIVMTQNLELKVDVSLEDIPWIKMGSQATITNESKSQSWIGRVVRMGQVVNQQTQSVNVYLEIKQNGTPLFDGNYLRTEIPGKSIDQAMVIDRNWIFEGNKVFILQDTLLKVKSIQVHKLNAETAVVSGLKSGVHLVAEPLVDAHNDMKAHPVIKESNFDDTVISKN